MKLGNIVQLRMGVSNLDDSMIFYDKLGFQKLSERENDLYQAVYTDGHFRFALCEDSEIYTELTYFSKDAENRLRQLEKMGIEINEKGEFVDSNGFGIRLIRINQHDLSEMHIPEGKPISKCGRFYEISLETDNVNESISFWEKLGFEIENREYGTINDGFVRISFYKYGTCPHKFKNPSITYFEPDMAERIAQLKKNGIPFIQELVFGHDKSVMDHGITEAPDGQYFFLFQYDW